MLCANLRDAPGDRPVVCYSHDEPFFTAHQAAGCRHGTPYLVEFPAPISAASYTNGLKRLAKRGQKPLVLQTITEV